MTWEIEPQDDGGSLLTVTTSGIVEGSRMAAEFSGGIVYIVSGLKTYLETGAPMSMPAEVRLRPAELGTADCRSHRHNGGFATDTDSRCRRAHA